MGDQATSTSGGAEQQAQQASDAPVDKGKGRAVEDVDMDEEDDSSDEESGAEEQVCRLWIVHVRSLDNTSILTVSQIG